MVAPGHSSNNPLPSKELALFKKIIKCYEQKQYKIGLRCAKSILSNPLYQEHGETLAMKGLILNCIGKHDEAMDCVKRGLRSDLKSHVCWHVYGLVHRADRKYDEAVKAYKMALKLDPDNLQILRDLSLLQIQIRDLEGYKKCRYDLLRLRPAQRVSWLGYATAYHLVKDYEKSLAIVNDFLINNEPTSTYDLERSELILYQNMLLIESGQSAVALTKLEENAAQVVDKVAYLEARASLLYELGRLSDAERAYRQLIDRNPECLKYYTMMEKCMGVENGSVIDRLCLLDDLATRHSRASAPRRLALLLAEGDDLRKRLHLWIVERLRKGIPSLFKSLIPLYQHKEKTTILECLLLDYVKRIEENGYRNGCLEDDYSHFESPTTAVWLYALVAQHYDKLGVTQSALKYVDRALQHTPTLIELLTIKAKIHKHAGDEQLAARVLEEAQSLDTADRFINSKAAKYLLRAARIEDAEAMCAKFTRENVRASTSLIDMQCMWFETEMGRAHRRLGQYGEALKMCHQMEQHFAGIYDDQFDFHTYCLRKSTLCAYMRLIRLEDNLRGHEFYYHAAKMAIKIYLRIIDRPGDIWPERNADLAGMSASELKKLKRKANKEKAQKAEAEQKKNQKDQIPPKENGVESIPVVGVQPDELLKCQSPLEEAAKFAAPFVQLGCKHMSGLALAFEVYRRKGKALIQLQCINEATRLDSTHPLLHICKIKFLLFNKSATYSPVVEEMVSSLLATLFPSTTDPITLNDEYRSQFKDSFPHRMAVAECAILVDPSSSSSVKASILRSFDEKLTARTHTMAVKLKDAVEYGRMGEWNKQELEQLTKSCNALFPHSTSFGGGSLSSVPTVQENGDAQHHSFE